MKGWSSENSGEGGGMKLEWGPGVLCAMVRIWSSSEGQMGGHDTLVFLGLNLTVAQFLD